MKLYNTRSQKIETLTSDDEVFKMYVCGVTPYDTTHLGHAFTYVCFDTLIRYLEHLGYHTVVAQNVTDIDDDILAEAEKRGVAWDELARRETAKYLADMRALNVKDPDYFPYATQEIDKMQDMVSRLLDEGHAYEKNGSVYYDIHRDPDFGRLVQLDYSEMLATANERGNHPDDPNKRDPLDFVLWQAAQPGEPTWDSPWGPGRPGWHIECSAMSMRYLGDQIDIHCGGADLIFPHHACEVAQSENYSDVKPFVRYWFHIAMVRLEGEKMSKSLGNLIYTGDLLKKYSPNAIRVYLLSHHYREEWAADGAEVDLEYTEKMLTRWREALVRLSQGESVLDPAPYRKAFYEAMDNDFKTPQAVKALDDLANAIIAQEKKDLHKAQASLRTLSGVLGVQFE